MGVRYYGKCRTVSSTGEDAKMGSKLSLHVRIMGIAVFVLVVLLVALYYGYYLAIDLTEFQDRIRWKTVYLTKIVSMVVEKYRTTNDEEAMKVALRDLLLKNQDEELASLRIRTAQGDLFYQVARREALSPVRYFERESDCVDSKRNVIAKVTIGYWRRGQMAGADDVSMLNTVIAVDVVVLVAVFLHLLLRDLVTRPLENFVDATKRISAGDLAELPTFRGSSREEDRLVTSFNEMIAKLRLSREELSRINLELEDRVARRTDELRAANTFSNAVIASVADGLYTVDRNKVIRVFNPAAERLTGLKAVDVIGRFCHEVFRYPFCGFSCILDRVHGARERQETLAQEEYLEEFETEGRSWLVVGSTFEGTGDFPGGVETIKDLSHIRRFQQKMRQVERLTSLGVLSAGVAHEINNPLSNVKIMAQLVQEGLLSRQPGNEAEVHSNVASIVEQIDRASSIVRKMLEFSRQSPQQTETVDIGEALIQSVEMVRYSFIDRGIEVQLQIESDLPRLTGDRLGLQQVFINLFNNARQAMKKGGRLVVNAHTAPCRIVVEVQDTGEGIRPEDLDRIFDPFFTTKEVGEGTGLGLSISYAIVKDHGGDLSVESQPGKGSLFTITLPV